MIGTRLKELRTQKRMTQDELAKIVEVSPSTIQKWEGDIADPNTKTLIKLAETFNCSLDYLFGFQDENRTTETYLLIQNIQGLDPEKLKEVSKFVDYIRGR